MSRFQCTFPSKTLLTPVTVTVILPYPSYDLSVNTSLDDLYQIRQKFKTLYLFHGVFADADSWLSGTGIELYAQQHGLAVVLPSVGNSFYADLLHGPAYWTFISEELPRFARAVFPLSDRREDNFVAGLSMGGYGAFKLALNKPDQFAAAISLSGVLDVVDAMSHPIHPSISADTYFGGLEKLAGSYNDLFAQLEAARRSAASLPKLYMAYGTEDFLYGMNGRFRDFTHSKKVDLTYEEGPGEHTFDFWDTYIRRALEWLANEGMLQARST